MLHQKQTLLKELDIFAIGSTATTCLADPWSKIHHFSTIRCRQFCATRGKSIEGSFIIDVQNPQNATSGRPQGGTGPPWPWLAWRFTENKHYLGPHLGARPRNKYI